MKRFWLKPLCAALALALLLPLFALPAQAVGVSVGSKTVKPGDSVSIRVSFSGKDIFGARATFTYDSSVLKFTGGSSGVANGNIVLYGGEKVVDSLSCTLNFTAIAAGTGTVSVNCSESYNRDLASLGGGSARGTITVALPPTPKPTVPVDKREIPVQVGEGTLYLWQTIPANARPEGSETVEADWQGKKVQLIKTNGLTLGYVTDGKGKNAALMVCDAAKGALSAYAPLTVAGQYTVLTPDDTAQLPEGYDPAQLTLNEQSVPAWQATGDGSGYYLLWAADATGTAAWYTYDPAQGSMQRYARQVVYVQLTPEPTPTPTPTPKPTPTPVPPTLSQRLAADGEAMAIIVCLLAAVAVLAAALIALCIKNAPAKPAHAAGKAAAPAEAAADSTADAEPAEAAADSTADAEPAENTQNTAGDPDEQAEPAAEKDAE